MERKIKRTVISVNFIDQGLLEFADKRAFHHESGMSGYIRDLVTRDQREWTEKRNVRDAALRKLTKEERVALGFPANI